MDFKLMISEDIINMREFKTILEGLLWKSQAFQRSRQFEFTIDYLLPHAIQWPFY